MNTVQWVSLARAIVVLLGGIAVGAGWATQADVDALSKPETLAQIVGAISAAVAIYYGWRARRAPNLIAATADLPEVGAVIAKPEVARVVPAANVVASATEAAALPGVRP